MYSVFSASGCISAICIGVFLYEYYFLRHQYVMLEYSLSDGLSFFLNCGQCIPNKYFDSLIKSYITFVGTASLSLTFYPVCQYIRNTGVELSCAELLVCDV